MVTQVKIKLLTCYRVLQKYCSLGDTACYSDGSYKILGRTSVDIIKSSGYKISALDIERHLLSHDDVTEVAVIGLPDHMFGQRIAAVLVLKEGSSLKEDDIKTWCKDRIPKYQVRNFPKTNRGRENNVYFHWYLWFPLSIQKVHRPAMHISWYLCFCFLSLQFGRFLPKNIFSHIRLSQKLTFTVFYDLLDVTGLNLKIPY